jgi:hypothetical protein
VIHRLLLASASALRELTASIVDQRRHHIGGQHIVGPARIEDEQRRLPYFNRARARSVSAIATDAQTTRRTW